MSTLQSFMKEYKTRIESLFPVVIDSLNCSSTLKESMLYSLQAGGKRIRPLLLYAVLESCEKEKTLGDKAALALEMIHTYSLIHDDLPAMDDDDLRRGKPTNHKVFGEATAILAGDALLTHSFHLIAGEERLTPEVKVEIINLLSLASGANGMVGGQTADMEAEGRAINAADLEAIHTHKTGDLLAVSLQIGAIIAGASREEQHHFQQFGRHIGLSFQIKDDLLDVEGDEALIGKPVGSDEDNDKNTYVKLLGLTGAKEKLAWHTDQASKELDLISGNTNILRELAEYIEKRVE